MTNEAELGIRERLAKLSGVKLLGGTRLSAEVERLQRQLERLREDTSDETVWRSVELARHQDRPYTLDYVGRIMDDWFELHGDRLRMDDHALVAGLGVLGGRTVALIGHQKGRDIHERSDRNFGMAYPEGYRKAMRVMELADRHGFPLVTLVDTPGAYPGVAAEQHGQGGAIARSQAATISTPPPSASPLIAAITGLSRSKRCVMPPKPVGGWSSTLPRARALRSLPTQKARSPVAVRIATRSDGSAA